MPLEVGLDEMVGDDGRLFRLAAAGGAYFGQQRAQVPVIDQQHEFSRVL